MLCVSEKTEILIFKELNKITGFLLIPVVYLFSLYLLFNKSIHNLGSRILSLASHP